LENGKHLKINYIGAGKGRIYFQKIELNKKSIPVTFIRHSDIIKGGVMNVYMGEKPLK